MAKILLLETATEVCGAAISIDGEVISIVEEKNSDQHASLLTLQIQESARQAGIKLNELDAIAMSSGPGSYTSLRVGVSVAKGLCYALNIQLISINSLSALAAASRQFSPFHPDPNVLYIGSIDARRDQICFQVFNHSLLPLNNYEIKPISNNMFFEYFEDYGIENNSFRALFSGNGSEKIKNVLNLENVDFSNINQNSACFLASIADKKFQLSEFQNFAHFEPIYMKPPNITTSKTTYF